MRRLIAIMIVLMAVFMLARFCFAQRAGVGIGGSFLSPAPPRLLFPITDNIDLSGKNILEFRWIGDTVNTDTYIFRLYKGRNTVASTLIQKEKISGQINSFQLDAALFEQGQTYTWSLQRVMRGGQKSDRVYSAFTIIKK